jgi:hypothetical protein
MRTVDVDRYLLRDGWPVALRFALPKPLAANSKKPARRRLSAARRSLRPSVMHWPRHTEAKRSA